MLTSVTFNGFIYKNGIIIRVKKNSCECNSRIFWHVPSVNTVPRSFFFFFKSHCYSFPSSISKGLDEKSDSAFMEKCEAIRAYTKIILL